MVWRLHCAWIPFAWSTALEAGATYALLSRIRLSSSTKVLATAERLIEDINSRYSEPDLTPEEIQSRAAKREDPLRDFSNICRAELEGMQKQLR
jgi:hypothetical protein